MRPHVVFYCADCHRILTTEEALTVWAVGSLLRVRHTPIAERVTGPIHEVTRILPWEDLPDGTYDPT